MCRKTAYLVDFIQQQQLPAFLVKGLRQFVQADIHHRRVVAGDIQYLPRCQPAALRILQQQSGFAAAACALDANKLFTKVDFLVQETAVARLRAGKNKARSLAQNR